MTDLVGIHIGFEGTQLGAEEGAAGWGRLQWSAPGAADRAPALQVRDKGKIAPGQAVHWVIPSDAIHLLVVPGPVQAGDLAAQVVGARRLGEVSLLTLQLAAVPGARMVLTLSGVQRQKLAAGAAVHVRLDFALVHVMSLRALTGAGGRRGSSRRQGRCDGTPMPCSRTRSQRTRAWDRRPPLREPVRMQWLHTPGLHGAAVPATGTVPRPVQRRYQSR